jgi:hypothetical protein
MRIRRGLLLCVAVVGYGIWMTAPAPGGTNYASTQLATSCVVNDTSYGPMIVAHTSWNMSSAYRSPDGYRWQARLIPTHPGLNFARPWNKVEVDDVGSPTSSSYNATVDTPPVNAEMDWDLEVKLTWDRTHARDWNVDDVLDFDERACATT